MNNNMNNTIYQEQQPTMHGYTQPQQMHLAQPNFNISFTTDEDAKNVLDQITPELREAFITIAIKHFQYDPMFLNYFKKIVPHEIDLSQPGQPGQLNQQPMVNQAPPMQMRGQQPQQQVSQSSNGGGFSDW